LQQNIAKFLTKICEISEFGAVLEVGFPRFSHLGKKVQKNENLAGLGLEKCCKMSIWLQKSVLIELSKVSRKWGYKVAVSGVI